MDIEKVISYLEEAKDVLGDLYEMQDEDVKMLYESLEYAIETLQQKQWIIEECENKIEFLSQELNANRGVSASNAYMTGKLGAYSKILKDLKGEDDDE